MSIFSLFKRKKKESASIVKKHNGKPFRYDIQALRALAVAAVVLYHLWPNRLVGGFTGVDIFFVISGFLMTTSVMGRLKPHIAAKSINPRNTLKILGEFYARRIQRLVPAALATLSATLVLAYLTNNLTIMVDTAKNVISSATFWQNWHLARQSVDYLAAGGPSTATEHFWSLSVEEQFYLVWPLLLILSTLLTINIVVLYKKQKISGTVLPITLLTIASFAYGYWLTKEEPSVAYFATPARIWELMLGGTIAFLPAIKNYDLKLLLPHVGLAMCLYSIFFITGDGFPGWHALIPTIGTALIIWAGIDKSESKFSFDKLFSIRPIQWIGNISYSIYLWHWPLIILLPVLIRQDIDGPYGKFIKLGILALSLILAQLSYLYIEETTRKVRLKLRYVYLLFIVATGIVVGGGFALQKYSQNQIDTRLKAMHTAALDEGNECFGARAIIDQNKCANPYGKRSDNYASVTKNANFHEIISTESECYSFHPDNKKRNNTKEYCTFGDKDASKNIILVGDSHIEQYANTFDYIGKKYNYKIHLLSTLICTTNWDEMNDNNICQDRWKFTNDKINKIYKEDKKSFIVASTFLIESSYVKSFLKSLSVPEEMSLLFIKDQPRITNNDFVNCYEYKRECTTSYKDATGDVDKIMDELLMKDY